MFRGLMPNMKVRGTLASTGQFEIGCLIAVRLCIAAFALLSATTYASHFKIPFGSALYSIYTPIAWLFGFCALSAIWLAWRKTGPLFTYLQFAADCALLTVVIWVTGNTVTPLVFLFIPIVAGAGLIAGRNVALNVTALSVILYSGLIIAIRSEFIPILQNSYHDYLKIDVASHTMLVTCLLLTLILTSYGSAYVRKLAFSGHELASKSQQELVELQSSSSTLVNELNEAIITTDLEGFVTYTNQAAHKLLDINPELSNCSAANIEHLFANAFPNTNVQLASNQYPEVRSELFSNQGDTRRHVAYSAKGIINLAGDRTGWLYILQDISQLRDMESQLEWQNQLSKRHEPALSDNALRSAIVKDFVGETPVMQKIFRIIHKVSASDANVLISGESGTGKELVARSLHKGSSRSKHVFVAINCGAIPENLIESQLFGHKKGSFTGADHDFRGLFLEANDGTIFLDEIGELPLTLQSKLLRVLQEKVVRPVGGDRDIPINVRIVSATNKELKKEVEKGSFREDLFYRLNVISINMPPLRDRKDDLPLLINSLLERHSKKEKMPLVTPASINLLMQYDYPGNIRELENILERALVLGGEVILPEHLPEHVQVHKSSGALQYAKPETQIIEAEEVTLPLDLEQLLNSVEKKYIELALLKSKGIKKDAADLLGINFRSFRYRLQKFNSDI